VQTHQVAVGDGGVFDGGDAFGDGGLIDNGNLFGGGVGPFTSLVGGGGMSPPALVPYSPPVPPPPSVPGIVPSTPPMVLGTDFPPGASVPDISSLGDGISNLAVPIPMLDGGIMCDAGVCLTLLHLLCAWL